MRILEILQQNKRAATIAGYSLLALITFVCTLFWTFPYERLKGRIIGMLSDKYEVKISEIGPTIFPGGVVIEMMALESKKKSEEDKVTFTLINEATLKFGLLSLISGGLDLDLEAQIGEGTLEGNVDFSKDGLETEFEANNLALHTIPGIVEAVGLPMKGQLSATMNLELSKLEFSEKGTLTSWGWADARGKVALECVDCTVGNGVDKMTMKPRSNRGRAKRYAAFASEGVTVPELSLGTASAEVVIRKGIGTIKHLSAQSKDGELGITGKIQFVDPFKESAFPGCLRFKFSEGLKKREPKFGNIESLLPESARVDDGYFELAGKGKLTALRWSSKRRCDGGAKDSKGEKGKTRPRVNRQPKPRIPPKRADTSASAPATEGPGEVNAAGRQTPPLDRKGEREPEVDQPGRSGPGLTRRRGPRGDDVLIEGNDDRRRREGSADGDNEDDLDESDDERDEGDEGDEDDVIDVIDDDEVVDEDEVVE